MAPKKKRKKSGGELGYSFVQAIKVLRQTDLEAAEEQEVSANTLRDACDLGLIESKRTSDKPGSHRRITQVGFRVLRDLVHLHEFKSRLRSSRANERIQALGHSEPSAEANPELDNPVEQSGEGLSIDPNEPKDHGHTDSVAPPGTVYSLEEAAEHLRLDADRVKRYIDAGDLKLCGEVLHIRDLVQFIDKFHGAYVVPILASPRFADQIPETGEGLIQIGRLVGDVETIDALPDEYRGPAFAAHDRWYAVWP